MVIEKERMSYMRTSTGDDYAFYIFCSNTDKGILEIYPNVHLGNVYTRAQIGKLYVALGRFLADGHGVDPEVETDYQNLHGRLLDGPKLDGTPPLELMLSIAEAKAAEQGSVMFNDPTDVVARQLLSNAIDDMTWEDMPDIDERDWLRIIERCKELAPKPFWFDDAIKILEDSVQEQGATPIADAWNGEGMGKRIARTKLYQTWPELASAIDLTIGEGLPEADSGEGRVA